MCVICMFAAGVSDAGDRSGEPADRDGAASLPHQRPGLHRKAAVRFSCGGTKTASKATQLRRKAD
jgi:hypothetical protein